MAILQPETGKLLCVARALPSVGRLASVAMWVFGVVAEVQRSPWLENSYNFQVGGVLFVAFVPELFVGLKNTLNWSVSRTQKQKSRRGFLSLCSLYRKKAYINPSRFWTMSRSLRVVSVFILYDQTTEVRGSNSTWVFFPLFPGQPWDNKKLEDLDKKERSSRGRTFSVPT